MKIGQKVKVKESELDGFVSEFRRKVDKNRVGIITGVSYPSNVPVVTFQRDGRRKEYMAGRIPERYLEIIEES